MTTNLPPRSSAPLWQHAKSGGLIAGLLSIIWLFATDAAATITFTSGNVSQNNKQVILRIGSPSSTIDKVSFDVNNTAIFDNSSITGTSSAGGSGVFVSFTARMRSVGQGGGNNHDSMQLTANSSTPLACTTPSTCGAQSIPFSTINWTVDNTAGISPGRFDDTSTQVIYNGTADQNDGTYVLQNTLTFHYQNNSLTPAGSYQGRIIFTGVVL